ncbi:helix-turn-helix domain-containing protein [Ralstonia pseudosolanacearum]|nr:helix-turn-helix transcriptional regulator [Ralstonia pseudosolanacearum]
MNQTQFAAIAGVGKTTQINYESGSRAPDVAYLAAVAKIGADVQYVVTGVRSPASLAPDETVLLEGYRGLDAATRKRMLAFMLGGVEPPEKGDKPAQLSHFEGSMQVFHQAPTGGNFVGRDLVKKKGK